MKRAILFVIAVMVANMAFGQMAKPTPKPTTKPTVTKKAVAVSANDELIALAKRKMSEEILLAKVAETKAAGIKYDTSAEALGKLQDAGVSQKVIAAIFSTQQKTDGRASEGVQLQLEPSVNAGPVHTPAEKHIGVSFDQPSTKSLEGREAGIYLVLRGGKLEQLEPSVYSGLANENKWVNTIAPFISKNLKAIVRSAASNLRLQNSLPTFYFFFENRGAGLSNTGGTFTGFMNSASSPNEFVIARMKVSKDERQITVAQDSTIKDRVGIPSKDTVDMTFKKVRSGVYEVRPRNPLAAGEYCFFYQGGAADKGGGGKLFDFGVDPGASSQ